MPETAVPTQDAGDSLSAELSANWDASESSSSGSPSPEVAPSPSAGEAQPSPPPEGSAGGERVRNADGTFAKGGKAPAKPAADGAAQPQAQAAQPAPAGFQVPEKWPADIKAKLQEIHSANPAHAEWLLGQYNTMRAISAQQQQKSQEYLKSYEQYLAPGRQERALRGVDDGTHIRHLLAADDFMRKSPEDGIRWLAHQAGIDLTRLANPQADGAPEIPPYVRELQQQVQQMRQAVIQQAQGAQQQQLQSVSASIDSFAKQVGQDGQPLYPYFDELLPQVIEVVQLDVQSGRAPDLARAYSTALRLNESVWLKDQRARSEEATKAAAAQRQREIEDAKRAGVTVSGSGADTSRAPGSIREELDRAWGTHG